MLKIGTQYLFGQKFCVIDALNSIFFLTPITHYSSFILNIISKKRRLCCIQSAILLRGKRPAKTLVPAILNHHFLWLFSCFIHNTIDRHGVYKRGQQKNERSLICFEQLFEIADSRQTNKQIFYGKIEHFYWGFFFCYCCWCVRYR